MLLKSYGCWLWFYGWILNIMLSSLNDPLNWFDYNFFIHLLEIFKFSNFITKFPSSSHNWFPLLYTEMVCLSYFKIYSKIRLIYVWALMFYSYHVVVMKEQNRGYEIRFSMLRITFIKLLKMYYKVNMIFII